jgi:cardiolipin synthase
MAWKRLSASAMQEEKLPFTQDPSMESALDVIYVALLAAYAISVFIALAVVFLERKNPSSTLAWIMVLFLLPGLGIILYLLFSQNIARRKLFRLTQHEKAIMEEPVSKQIDAIKHDRFDYAHPVEAIWKDLIMLNQNYAKAYLTQDNRISLITDGKHMMASLLSDIEEAKEYINLEFFIVKNDDVGRRLISALTEKARQGVKVRFLFDALGSRKQTHLHLREFHEAGGKYAFFFPPKIRFLNLMFNYRNHRKIVVIDGKAGYLGGFNIGNEYLGNKKKFGYWRDTHLRMSGECLQDLNARFFLDWRLASRERMSLDEAYVDHADVAGSSAVQIVSSGPDSLRQEVKHAYLKMMSSAQKNIYIQTPYFVPDNSIFDTLQNAVHSGVDVRIMIPSIPDHIFVYWATYYYCGLLLRSGVKVYIYDNGFLHSKTMSVDGEVCSVGSANFDIRSFKLNFETNAFIFDEEEAYKLEAIFEEDMTHCHELTRALYKQRSLWIRFKEGIARLLSDIL